MTLVYTTQPACPSASVTFVHGLDGHGPDIWGPFPARLAKELPGVSVATYEYRSGLRGFIADPALTLEGEAQGFSEVVSSLLARHRSVAIVGHCLGGLLATLALRNAILERRAEPDRITLFLLDTPYDLPETGPSDWLAGLLKALKFPSATFRGNASYWNEHWRTGDRRSTVNAYAVTSEDESWISGLTPDANLPPDRVFGVPLEHAEIARPPGAGAFPTYDFVLAKLREQHGFESWTFDARRGPVARGQLR